MRTTARMLLGGLVGLGMLALLSVPLVAAEDQRININTASAVELAAAKGLGDVKAKAIVEFREKNGPFQSVEDLTRVKGIGPQLLAKLRPQVTAGPEGPAARDESASMERVK